jgi:light-regulated signal transduction histidine kinase (bacteriophytochrome)
MGELAAGVGHEINNPLAIASGYLELVSEALVHETRTNSSLRVFLQKISHSLNRIRDIVDELRDYARTGGENFETIELSGVVKNSYGLIRELQEKDGTAIIFSCEGPEIHVRGTSGKIQQIVYNLVQNASDAVESSGTRQICVSVQKIKSQGIISVTDNGIGIPEDNLSRVFDTFFTTKEVGRGTGMGLGIAARLVKELDGQILVESKEGVGSVFRVILPLATKSKVTSVQPEAEEATKPLSPLESSGSVVKRRVLVVDDEPDIREILINELEEIGDYEGVEAKDGQEALELVRSEDFDIIFTDLKMPVMSGTQLLLKIWELRLNPRPILIAVTGGFGLDNQKVGQHNLIDLVDGFILKPFDSGQISKAILDAEKNRETSLQKAMVG